MEKLSNWFFRNRSYTPIPFLIVMLMFTNFETVNFITGLSLAVLGEAIRLWAVSYAGSETRTTKCAGGTYLVITGPFAYVRNPLYVGNILIYTGLAIMSNVFFPYFQIVAFIFFLFQYRMIIISEEKYLRNCFKNDYQDYYSNVPRFIPRVTPYIKGDLEQPTCCIKSGLKSEARSLQAFTATLLLLIITNWIKTID